MFILIFLIILSVLVFVHEMGHFLTAKAARVKVEEFGFGYPPKAVKLFRKWDTDFTLNWVPFGGFVKILGENYIEEETSEKGRRFTDASKWWQVVILAAGVTFNVLLAWVLISTTYMIGTPYPVTGEYENKVSEPFVMVTSIMPGLPAEKAGIKPGDVIESVMSDGVEVESVHEELTTEAISDYISTTQKPISFHIKRGQEQKEVVVTPVYDENNQRFVIGISMDRVGILKLSFVKAIVEGARATKDIFVGTVVGMGTLLSGVFKGKGDLSQVAGPVGIVGLVKDAYMLGISYLLSFTAFISINLAVINLIPFPALDGGRILMVIVEALKGSRVKPIIYNTVNTIGFIALLCLMALITYNDILRLFH